MAAPDGAPDAPTEHLEPGGRDIEAPAADAEEQAVSAVPVEESVPPPTRSRRSFEVGEWDAMEQSIVIDMDDEYDR